MLFSILNLPLGNSNLSVLKAVINIVNVYPVRYMLRVTAHNNAGFTVAEYEFATLTVNGGKLEIIFCN